MKIVKLKRYTPTQLEFDFSNEEKSAFETLTHDNLGMMISLNQNKEEFVIGINCNGDITLRSDELYEGVIHRNFIPPQQAILIMKGLRKLIKTTIPFYSGKKIKVF